MHSAEEKLSMSQEMLEKHAIITLQSVHFFDGISIRGLSMQFVEVYRAGMRISIRLKC